MIRAKAIAVRLARSAVPVPAPALAFRVGDRRPGTVVEASVTLARPEVHVGDAGIGPGGVHKKGRDHAAAPVAPATSKPMACRWPSTAVAAMARSAVSSASTWRSKLGSSLRSSTQLELW
jgi:hypothetical protein